MAIGDRSRLVRLPEGQIRRIHQRRRATQSGAPARTVGPIRRFAPSDAPTPFPLGGATLEPRELSLSEITAGTHGRTPLDWLPSRDPSAEQVLIRADRSRKLRGAMERLSRQEREVLALRFGLDDRPTLTLREVGRRLTLSNERIRQIELRAKSRLAVYLRSVERATPSRQASSV